MARILRYVLAFLLLCGGTLAAAATAAPVLYDHHVHIWPPDIAELLTKELKLEPPLPTFTAMDLRKVIDSGHVGGVTILSNAYMYSASGRNSPEMVRKMKAVNDWTADQAQKLGGGAVVFCSFNPLADEALAELERCRKSGRFAGIKLHFTNSRVDLRNPAHLAALKRVFRAIDAARLPIVVHMRTEQKHYGRPEAEIFIRKLLPFVRHVPVQIAHAAGWGGFDPATDGALTAFANATSTGELRHNRIYFDLSAVVRGVHNPAPDATASWWPEHRYDRLLADLRRIGLKHFLFGTDYPDWTPAEYRDDLAKAIPFAPGELDTIIANRAPWDRPIR